MKKFFLGFGIVVFIVLIYSFISVKNQIGINLFELVVIPLVSYFVVFVAGLITRKIYSNKMYLITKYAGIIFFIAVTLAISDWDNITTMIPFIIAISIICNWNNMETK